MTSKTDYLKNMYKIYDDGDGHKKLIPYGIWQMFLDKVNSLEEWSDEWCDYLDNFDNLEGADYAIMLESDLAKY